ncbi:MAG: WD repeat-containing protein jip5 [Thelocarpon superellum]|nr:MAG: WD repeat-containing protein jip5 [Thelocarpon superellum]
MYENVCKLPLTSDLFAQALHPTEPLLAVGLAAGHVEVFRLPSGAAKEDGTREVGNIKTAWRTKRHKGSCRSLGFSIDGKALYSAGTDGIIKEASTSTGQVTSKLAIPYHNNRGSQEIDAPALLHVICPQTLLVGTDSSALHLFDLRSGGGSTPSQKPQQTFHPHADYISSITPLPPNDSSTSGFAKQWVSTGGSTLTVTDLRRGVMVKSEDQEEELLASVLVSGLGAKPGGSKGDKVVVGGSSGVLTLWERGIWDDQEERIVVDRGVGGGESIDSLALLPEGDRGAKHVAAGMGDGTIRIVRLGLNKIVAEIRHDEVENVMALNVEATGGSLISGGGQIVSVWTETVEDEDEEEVDGQKSSGSSEDEEEEAEDSSSDEEERFRGGKGHSSSKQRKKRRLNGTELTSLKKSKATSNKPVWSFSGLD